MGRHSGLAPGRGGALFEQAHGLGGISLHLGEVAERANRLKLALAEAVAAKDLQALLALGAAAAR